MPVRVLKNSSKVKGVCNRTRIQTHTHLIPLTTAVCLPVGDWSRQWGSESESGWGGCLSETSTGCVNPWCLIFLWVILPSETHHYSPIVDVIVLEEVCYDRERQREREREIACATSYWHKYLFTTRQKLAPCQSVSVSLYFPALSLSLSVLLSVLQHSLVQPSLITIF